MAHRKKLNAGTAKGTKATTKKQVLKKKNKKARAKGHRGEKTSDRINGGGVRGPT